MTNIAAKNDWLERFGLLSGVLPKGARNTICDVDGVRVGHVTLAQGDQQTGVTAIIPAPGSRISWSSQKLF